MMSDLEKYVGHYSKYQDPTSFKNESKNFIKVIDSDISRKVDFKRVAVHQIILPPGCRTSSPHAESLEEEFVFVLKGRPHLWLNGYIHDLDEGFAVGFPSGTGIAHTFINNTDSDVQFLVAGERTKKENLCSFPVNPELKESCDIWWDNPPTHELGPHNGLPGPIKDSERSTSRASCIIDCNIESRRQPFHYPGDNETFGNGFRITDKVGLKALGIWFENLPPGRRSAFPHAHTHEEEFVFILKGSPTVWLDGYTKELSPDYFAAFPSNTGVAHTLINNTNEDVMYICIGETQDFPDEKICYPLHPLRQNECTRKGWYWTDLPQKQLGPHNGKPNQNFNEHIKFKVATKDNATEVFEIFRQSKQYFLKVDGCEPTLKIAEHALVDGPKQPNDKYFKEFLIIEMDGKNVGVLDLHANHPEVGMCYLGLLLITEDLFSKGLGTRVYELAEDYIKRALGCKKIRLGISDDNNVTGFWIKMGFQPNGKTYSWKGEEKTSMVSELDKELTANLDFAQVRLVEPSYDYKDSYLKGYKSLTSKPDQLAWLYLEDDADINTPLIDFNAYVGTLLKRKVAPPDGFVCDTIYWALYNNQMIGRISIRHELNEFLKKVGGHIGYVVHPDWRNKGVATWMLREILKTEKARQIGRLLLTCDQDNLASEKTIINNGGLFDQLIDLGASRPAKKHFWITI